VQDFAPDQAALEHAVLRLLVDNDSPHHLLFLELAPCALLDMPFNSLSNARQSTCDINFAQFKSDNGFKFR
jgi:hypothetical protein